MALDKTIYLKGLKYLNAYYNTFKFDVKDDMKLGVWYSAFEDFDNEDFTNLVKAYCKNNPYAPQSPTSLLDYGKTLLLDSFMTSDEAWETTISLLRALTYDFSRFYKQVDNPLISSTVKAIESQFYGVLTENLPYVRNDFKKAYEDNARVVATQKANKGDLRLAKLERLALNDSAEVK